MQMAGLEALSPQERARVIYTQARSEMTDRLWQAAIGNAQDERSGGQMPCHHSGLGLPMEMMAMLGTGGKSPGTYGQETDALAKMVDAFVATPSKPTARTDNFVTTAPIQPNRSITGSSTAGTSITSPLSSLGANSRFAGALQKAAERSGLPAPALAAIIDAEAAKRPDGSWNLMSRNPRSSAAGLGQFLSGTWIGMAQKPGNWLYDTAMQKGWLTDNGRVKPSARSSLLALRYDAEASINSIADYARSNITVIRKAGVRAGEDSQTLARIAYLGHHLGPGDAIRYLKGGLGDGRAAHLLKAQIGSASALDRIARTGDASAAHRDWLDSYIARKIRPDRFAGLPQTTGT